MNGKGVRQYLVRASLAVFVAAFVTPNQFSSASATNMDGAVTTQLAVKVLETHPRLLKIADQTKKTWGVLIKNSEQAKTNHIAKKEAKEAARRAAEKARREREKRLAQRYKSADQALSTWLKTYAHGDLSIEVYNVNSGTTIASYNANKSMRARSLYKLFYLYDAYADMTLGKCLDSMVRYSNNSCAEAMYNDKARSKRVAQLISRLGLSSTAKDGLATSAHDMVKLLLHFYKHPEWSGTSWAKFRDSARNQPYAYRKGLPSGFKSAAVYNKTGFGGIQYNDAAMVEFPNGKKYIIVVMTTNTRYSAIADLGRMLENTLK